MSQYATEFLTCCNSVYCCSVSSMTLITFPEKKLNNLTYNDTFRNYTINSPTMTHSAITQLHVTHLQQHIQQSHNYSPTTTHSANAQLAHLQPHIQQLHT